MLGVDADSMPSGHGDDRWMYLTNVARHFERLLSNRETTESREGFSLAMRVLDTFEPLDVKLAQVIGGLLPVNTAGKLWVEDVTATAWRIVSSVHGARRLAELRDHAQ